MGNNFDITTSVVERKKKIIEGNAALLVIDMQGKSLEAVKKDMPEGLTLEGFEETVPQTKMVIDACRKAGIPVIYTREWHRKNLVDLGRETDGSEGLHCMEETNDYIILEEVAPEEGDYVINKQRYSCFYGTGLEIILNGLNVLPGDTLIFTGCMTNVCVHYGSMDAHQRDYHIRVVEECCSGSSRKAHEDALDQINYLQTGAVTKLDNILSAISKYKPVRSQAPGVFAGFPVT
ncbi:MAG: cysteine hydrolase [Desulfobacterales bacterium]|nr:cysteine hydrolase [Desulfobacterales bacterium]